MAEAIRNTAEKINIGNCSVRIPVTGILESRMVFLIESFEIKTVQAIVESDI